MPKDRPNPELRLVLEAAASPERVAEAASMFADTLTVILPDLAGDAVTMVVENFEMRAAVRARSEEGALAVNLLEQLIENPTRAVQRHPQLAPAARRVATYSQQALPSRPRFLNAVGEELAIVDRVFVQTMKAAGSEPQQGAGTLGETLVYSRIYRVGRVNDGGRLMARIRVDGRPLDVRVELPEPHAVLWEVAKKETVVPIRLTGRWEDADDGPVLKDLAIVSLDATFQPWQGRELLRDVERQARLFESADFDAMLSELNPD